MKESIEQLKAWFRRGKYPTEAQFAAWLDSYWHKDEKIAVACVENLAALLNGKYSAVAARLLELAQEKLRRDFDAHKQDADEEWEKIENNRQALVAEDARQQKEIEENRQLIGNLRETDSELGKRIEGLEEFLEGVDDDMNLITLLEEQKNEIGKAHASMIDEAMDRVSGGRITWAELVKKRDSGQLWAGAFYRITDYVTTVANDEEARSAGHVFDVVVMALDGRTLSERAWAINSERDTEGYFAGAKLSAWQVWYCLDNDTMRFQWADTKNGRGVIYRLIDEWGNDCPYDFKNVQFKRYKVIDTSPNGELAYLDGTYIGMPGELQGLEIDTADYVWAYTFSYGVRTMTPTDGSLLGFGDGDYYGCKGFFGSNVLKPTTCYVVEDELKVCNAYCLNNIIWFTANDWSYHVSMNNNIVESECINMTLNGFATWIGYDSQCIIMGEGCRTNNIGSGAYSNTFGNGCNDNTFGNNCGNNTFGFACLSNTFGNDCRNNTFGDECWNNTFGDKCCRNTFGDGASSNTFGDDCDNNTFGGVCYSNTFGNDCDGNTFGNYLRYITLGESVYYLNMIGGTDYKHFVQNAQILNGTAGEDGSAQLTVTIPEGGTVCRYVGQNTAGELKIWVPADMV